MELSTAVRLVRDAVSGDRPQTWADLGCGSGLFTRALASLLLPPSVIFAVDRDAAALREIPSLLNGNTVNTVTADFTDYARGSLRSFDGTLIANALHFMKEKAAFISDLKKILRSNAILIILEYDMDQPNPWVPYPVSVQSLETLLSKAGFAGFRVIGREPSRYRRADIYAAAASSSA